MHGRADACRPNTNLRDKIEHHHLEALGSFGKAIESILRGSRFISVDRMSPHTDSEDLTMNSIPGTFRTRFRVVSLGLLFLAGCATSVPSGQAERMPYAASDVNTGSKKLREVAQVTPVVENVAPGEDDAQALQGLWERRTESAAGDASSNFALGPGDVLRISLPQLNSQAARAVQVSQEDTLVLPPNNGPYDGQGDVVRVSEEGTIALPMLGVINVSGLTEAGLRDELIRRVANYVYKPQVGVFLEHTENRDVAVLGSVKNPGRYMLTSRSDTVMTMLGRAGGRTEDAASRIILVPAPRAAAHSRAQLAAATFVRDAPPDDWSHAQPTLGGQVVINLSQADNQRYLELQVRPSDVIIVPAAGEVTVEGWVPNPGKFKITPGMTVLSAIAAAGGAEFTSSATLLREQGNGGKFNLPLDLSKLKSGTEPDAPLEGGDVVVVERSVAGAVPYSLYFLISHLGMGIGLPVL